MDELQLQVNNLKNELEELRYILTRKTGLGSADIKANIISPSNVQASTITSGAINNANMFSSGVVDQAAIGAAAVGQSELKYETATLAFGSGDTSKTASVTSGSIIIGVYSSVVTSTPAYGELQLSISGTTLTGTRSATPGGAAAITYTVVLLKT